MLNHTEQLALRLAGGLADAPEPIRDRHADYLAAAQRPDGGWAGREGPSDPYYTGFALRSLAMLGRLGGGVAERAAGFLSRQLPRRQRTVDLISLVHGAAALEAAAGIDVLAESAGPDAVEIAGALERLRRDDGGYAKGPSGHAGSTYQTYLVCVCRQLLGLPPVEPEQIIRFILSQRCEGGGFREIHLAKRAGTNPTAAAVAALRITAEDGPDALDWSIREETAAFLVAMQTAEGGLKANTRIPTADLLSTFTGLVTLAELDVPNTVDRPAAARYAVSLELPQGGFRGAAWDTTPDVEYTFYGLGCLAMLRVPT